MFFLIVYALLKTQQTAPERKRNASEADKQQANKEQTIVIRTAGGSTCPAATRLLRRPGLLHTSHCVVNCACVESPQRLLICLPCFFLTKNQLWLPRATHTRSISVEEERVISWLIGSRTAHGDAQVRSLPSALVGSERLSLKSQFWRDYRKKFATCFISSLVLSWALVESARKLGAWWQILTLPRNDTASVANSLICHQRHVELAGGFSASFFLSFSLFVQDWSRPCRCTVACSSAGKTCSCVRQAGSPGRLRTLAIFFLGHGLPGGEPLRSRVSFTLPVLLCAFRAMIFSMFSKLLRCTA